MWDSNSLLQLLNSMPNELSKEHLEKIQMLIDADKYKCSLLSGFNLCDMNMYAPFCAGCSKTSIYPCAVAYLNMMKANGMGIEVGAKPAQQPEQNIEVSQPQNDNSSVLEKEELYEEAVVTSAPDNNEVYEAENIEEPAEKELVTEEEPVVAEQPEQQTEDFSEQPAYTDKPQSESVTTTEKRKIRIAVARKRL